MKRYLPMALSLFLCHCGTEVGNGIAPEPKRTGTTTGASTGTATPTAEGASNDNKSPSEMSNSMISTSFLAACASPFAESIAGSFANADASSSFTVTITADAKKAVTALNSSSVLYTITAAPNISSYAIEALSASPAVTCGAVTTQTLMDGSLQRSVTLSNGDLVQWTLSAGKVISMKLTRSSLVVETWTQK
jgi:hypothetical protein